MIGISEKSVALPLKYQSNDVTGLLEAMVKYADYIYDKYDLNLTNYTTSPSLSFANYGLNYYNEDLGVKKVKGPIEKAIRESYYGGNVDVFVNNDNRILFGNYGNS